MVDNKRKKFHDKDKYYRLAKEQGLRSRAAFKLSQINRKFPVLEKCHSAVLDLCAAPGGWTQIAARTCPSSVKIVAVDILPIRPLSAHRNVTTLIGDITTDKCKSDIQRILKGQGGNGNGNRNNSTTPVDLVLHDGAPNVGADYSKDAYTQNEITLHAVRTATQHLRAGGTFVTKVYRSRDYAALHWVLQQLFDDVAAFKPTASRQQSAEIFWICQGYKAPVKLDPALTDPKRVFEMVEGETTGGSGGAHSMTVFHKNWEKPRRQRGGYNMEHLDATMRHIEPVDRFVTGSSVKEAIQMLSSSTGLAFQCDECRGGARRDDDDEDENNEAKTCNCSFFLHHPFTTPEIKQCVSDLQLLNKTDFKGLLTWRSKLQDALAAEKDRGGEEDSSDDGESEEEEEDELAGSMSEESEREEAEIQGEIAEMRARRQRERKRRKKKERAVAAKRRKHAALGMDLNAIDVPEHDKVFSLTSITSKGDLLAASEVNLDRVTDEQLFGGSDDDEDVVVGGMAENSDSDDDADSEDEETRIRRQERDLDEAYNEYLQNTKDGMAKSGTKMAKRSKKLERQKVVEEAQEDQEMAMTGADTVDYNTKTYAKLLQGGQDDSDDDDGVSSSDEDDDGFDADPLTPEEHAARAAKKESSKRGVKKGDIVNPLIHKFADEPTSAKTARWFSNPLFANLGKAAQAAAAKGDGKNNASDNEDSDSESDSTVDEPKGTKKQKITADDVLASMPKTDKQKRHEKRLKQMERDERKKSRQAKKLGDTEGEFQLVAGRASDDDSEEEAAGADHKLDHLSDAQRKRVLEARELIKAGLGSSAGQDDDAGKNRGIEIVAQDETMISNKRPLPVMDDRKYDSDHEDYDSDDYAQTLALGTMMLRRSKEKAFVDASYNRYAWNDPAGLPEWFVDDENKHYRPQLPIPPALVAKMKEKMMALSAKPIAKVAEARARKSKRAKTKLAAAKKQAQAVANSSEMSEAMKLKAISKALQGQESKRPGKTYVVAKKGRGNQGVKGAKLVDKRLKSDKRAMGRIDKKRKKGKQNGLVGSKKRRHHK